MKNFTKKLLVLGIVLCASQAWSATYYMRADGTAPNKAAATSCSSAATAMSAATHNSESFAPDDVICLCSDGGDFKTSIIAPSSGTAGHPITYTNATGKTPTIDLSVNMGKSGWTDVGSGVYKKKGCGRILWEDGVPLHAASSNECTDGNWYYVIGSLMVYYKPTTGTPADHNIEVLWFPSNGLDLRNRSYITVSGLNFNRCGYGIAHGQNTSSPVSRITGISIHDNTITRCYWGIFSNLIKNGLESSVSIYNNYLSYCNSGISAWTSSDTTPGHTQHHTRYLITKNKVLNLSSLTDTVLWWDALLKAYQFTDHEGISFQDVRDSRISYNIITTTFDRVFNTDALWTRAIYFYLTNGITKTTGNIVEYNYIVGHYYPAIYISAAIGNAGVENNIFRYNILSYKGTGKDHISFIANFYAGSNPATGTNQFVNNTIYNASGGLAIKTHAGSKNDDSVGTWIFRNNIINSQSFALIISEYSRLTFDHNIYKNLGTGGWNIQGAGMQFANWQSKGFDVVGSLLADPSW